MTKYIRAIQETEETLKSLLSKQTEVQRYKKVQILLLIKTGSTIEDTSRLLFMNRTTIYEWLKRYQQKGLIEYLDQNIKNGRPRSS